MPWLKFPHTLSSIIRFARHEACIGQKKKEEEKRKKGKRRNVSKVWFQQHEERDQLGRSRCRCDENIKILKKHDLRERIEFKWVNSNLIQQDNKPLTVVKVGKFLHWQSEYQFWRSRVDVHSSSASRIRLIYSCADTWTCARRRNVFILSVHSSFWKPYLTFMLLASGLTATSARHNKIFGLR
jgi:hypothetical protein